MELSLGAQAPAQTGAEMAKTGQFTTHSRSGSHIGVIYKYNTLGM